ncbi:hypothetical protein RJ53_00025 [Methanocalculus chunghsingensis]|uniref:Roadblock/LAMTOR2 domain-containing protein n=1 Tax=Methanocalculus chunghsingensis TaxID=156457 RepID=A0A8J8B4D7_9EURY|nr:roadblock/LC7 domain-containing protein [Methanocalculus chunghsingensis]MBR1367963.1 hypothetical protein [Methanocalculus chunghsingensis]
MSSPGTLKEKVRHYIDDILAVPGIIDCALVSNDGILIGKSFEDSISAQSFGAMCATMIASSEAAASVVNVKSPFWVLVKSEDKMIIVIGAGARLLIAAIVDVGVDVEVLSTKLLEIGESIGGTL